MCAQMEPDAEFVEAHGIRDATAFLKERAGDMGGALELILTALDRAFEALLSDGDDADGDTVDVEAFIAFVRQNSEHVELKRERVFPSGGSLSSLHDGRAPGDALGARPHVAVAVAS